MKTRRPCGVTSQGDTFTPPGGGSQKFKLTNHVGGNKYENESKRTSISRISTNHCSN